MKGYWPYNKADKQSEVMSRRTLPHLKRMTEGAKTRKSALEADVSENQDIQRRDVKP